MSRPISLTTRMSLLFALSAISVLVVAGAAFEHALRARFLKNDKVELDGKMEVVRNIVQDAGRFEDASEMTTRLRDIVFGHPGLIISVRTGTGRLFSVGDPRIASELIREKIAADAQPTTRSYGKRVYRFISTLVQQGNAPGEPAQVAIALDITDDQSFLDELRRYLWFGMGLISLVLGWVGWMVVRHGLAPLRHLSTAVAAVSTSELDRPLENKSVPKELQELVAAFNTMLARLHESFRRLSDFSSDIAHELKTPIQNLLLQTQVTLSGQDSLEAYRAALQSNEEEYQRLSTMISDMLFLAKADNRLLSLKKEPMDLAAEVATLFEFYEAFASDLDIRLLQSGNAEVVADRLMLQRALSNLLSNALRFTPRGMAIKVTMQTEGGWARLAVANPGPEIPLEHRERIFERLYRIDPSRREGHTDNVGLGLAITRSILEMHGGKIEVDSRDGWVTFLLMLPTAA
jgi:two-component system heavy metal sensor histidine kinase CusS